MLTSYTFNILPILLYFVSTDLYSVLVLVPCYTTFVKILGIYLIFFCLKQLNHLTH